MHGAFKFPRCGGTCSSRTDGEPPITRTNPLTARSDLTRDLYRHRHLIHDLSLSGDTAGLENYNYPNLRRLGLHNILSYTEDLFLELLKTFPSLVELEFTGHKLSLPTLLALSAHPCIANLSLNGGVIKAMDAPIFWEVCGKLESLLLHGVSFENGAIPAGVVLDRLHNLRIFYLKTLAISDQLDLLLRCPNLRVLHWMEFGTDNSNEYLNLDKDRIPEGYWHCLQELEIQRYFQDKQVASIFRGVGSGNLVNMTLGDCHLGEQATKALGLHHATLVELDLWECRSVSSTFSRDVLSSCPRLKTLHTQAVLARDVVNGGPWVCQQLQTLAICFLFGELELDLQHGIFGRLSTLTRLEFLLMRIPSDDESFERGRILEFRLENGLEQLATLQQLTTMDFEESEVNVYAPQMGKHEAGWMLANWKKLRSILGVLNDDPSTDSKLMSMFKIFDINTF